MNPGALYSAPIAVSLRRSMRVLGISLWLSQYETRKVDNGRAGRDGDVCLPGRTPARVYDLNITEAYQRLAAHKLPDLVFAKQCGILIHVRPEGVPDRQVRWRVYSSGQQVVEFTAALTAIGDKQTKVVINMPRGADGREAYDGSQFYTRPAFNQPLRPAVEEQVAAILESRAFDVRRVGPGKDKVCLVQRGGLESGRVFRVDDVPGMDARQSADCRDSRRSGGRC